MHMAPMLCYQMGLKLMLFLKAETEELATMMEKGGRDDPIVFLWEKT